MSTQLDLSRYRGAQTASLNSGGAAFDRRIPDDDHNPLKNAYDWNDPTGFIADTARDIGMAIRDGLVNVIKELTGIDLSELLAVFDGIDLSPGGIIAAIEGLLEDVPVLGDIIRIVKQVIFGGVPVGAITNAQPNLLTAGMFGAASIGADSEWTIDSTTSRSGDGSGSAKLICDGRPHALRSGANPNDRILVSAGQKITQTIYVKHQDYVGSGAAIQLQIAPFKDAEPREFVTLDSYTPAQATIDWPGRKMSGDYTVPEGVTAIQFRALVTREAISGTLWFDDAEDRQTSMIQQSWIEGLAGEFQGVIARIQAFIDTVVNAFTGSTDILHSLEDVVAALLAIPFGNVLGVGGPANIGQSIIDFIDHLTGGLVGQQGSGAGLADVFNISHLVSSWASLGNMAWDILGIRNNTPVYNGLLPNGKSNYPITGINTTLDATQAASLISTYRVGESSPLGVVSWLGYGTTGLSAFYCNIWKISATTGDWTLAHHSPNIVGNLAPGTTPQWNFYELAAPLAVTAGEQYAFELVPVGGTHHVRGMSTTDTIPDHPYANVVGMAATRNNTSPNTPPTSIPKASVTRSGSIAWVEVAIDTGSGPGHHDPITVYFTESGSVPIPNWAGFIEVIALGGGGGGKSGGTAGFYGEGGSAGRFGAMVWERGVDFNDTVTSVTVTVGAGGAGGSAFGNGADGGSSSCSITGHTLTVAGGDGGDSFKFGGHTVGAGAGSYTFNDQLYLGGADQNVYSSGGTSPGGGGAGGNWITVSSGGPGGAGACWVRFRQGAIAGGGDVPDTTPPTTPTVTLDSATYSTLTVTASGSTDV